MGLHRKNLLTLPCELANPVHTQDTQKGEVSSDDGTAGRLAASVRPDEAFDDVQGLWQRCPAACRLVLQCRSGQITGIWQASQKPTNTKDRVGRQEFLS